jgi:hypothetical protein
MHDAFITVFAQSFVFGVETRVVVVHGCGLLVCIVVCRLLKPKEEITQIEMDKRHRYRYP